MSWASGSRRSIPCLAASYQTHADARGAAAKDLLYLRKRICVNDGFVGIFNDDLLLLGDAASFFGLVADHLALVVDHVPDVHRVMEHTCQAYQPTDTIGEAGV